MAILSALGSSTPGPEGLLVVGVFVLGLHETAFDNVAEILWDNPAKAEEHPKGK